MFRNFTIRKDYLIALRPTKSTTDVIVCCSVDKVNKQTIEITCLHGGWTATLHNDGSMYINGERASNAEILWCGPKSRYSDKVHKSIRLAIQKGKQQ